MKRLFTVMLLAACMLPMVDIAAQDPLLDTSQMPNAVLFLPPPPEEGSAAFEYDKAQYQWGKEQRKDSVRLAIATRDAQWGPWIICQEFSEPVGYKLSEENTPAIYEMLSVGVMTTDQVGRIPKRHYRRTRPYVYYKEHTIYPPDEDRLRVNGSYPSGHTILGWSAALLLSELVPEKADTIMARGYMYGQSRVIAGYHWQSDVDAGRLAASAAVARLHADKRFQKLMKKARREAVKLGITKCR